MANLPTSENHIFTQTIDMGGCCGYFCPSEMQKYYS